MDRNALKVQALLEKISNIVTNYENQLADSRVEYTLLQAEFDAVSQELKSLKPEEDDDGSVPETPTE